MHLQYSFFCTRGRLEIINLSADQYIPKWNKLIKIQISFGILLLNHSTVRTEVLALVEVCNSEQLFI